MTTSCAVRLQAGFSDTRAARRTIRLIWLRLKRSTELSLPHHLLAVRIKGVVHNPLRGVDFLIVAKTEAAKSIGDGLQSRALRLLIQRVVRIGAVDNFRKQCERRIVLEFVFLENCLKRASLPFVAELDALHVKGDGAHPLGLGEDVGRRNEEELGLRVYEFLDQPGAGDSVDVYPLSCNPFHGFSSSFSYSVHRPLSTARAPSRRSPVGVDSVQLEPRCPHRSASAFHPAPNSIVR